mmetsp:Transcript_23683/g.61521  ORF Transcript_23683/g.61521 Transcript_23683/m.61521 type:complete len:266 (+) Transcript_23683:628-1425(+)
MLHVEYTSLPLGRSSATAVSIRVRWYAAAPSKSASLSSCVRRGRSPSPVHGASSMMYSNDSGAHPRQGGSQARGLGGSIPLARIAASRRCCRANPLALSCCCASPGPTASLCEEPSSPRSTAFLASILYAWMQDRPSSSARSRMVPAFSCVRSSAMIWPASPICSAIAVVFPPGAAHMSSTQAPGGGANTAAATMLGRFCSMTWPGSNPAPEGMAKTGCVISTAKPRLLRNISLRPIAVRPTPMNTVACSDGASCCEPSTVPRVI